MSDAEKRIAELMSEARQYTYYATKTTGESFTYWVNKAEAKIAEAGSVPNDFKYPEFVMPEWGTYGT